ncbi:MAG: hypothetical protein HOC24_10975 [Deltaproteobacteria bacterium]|nr:hypothetical protein [Deltaproteobacteria bacterium]
MDVSQLNVLFMVSSFNGLSQKVWSELNSCYAQSELLIGVDADVVEKMAPDIILCPFMKAYIPDRIWQNYPCLVIHPGPSNDGGPSSLNWAVLEGQKLWGVTILQAGNGWDRGKILAGGEFILPKHSVSSIYRNEVADLAIQLLPEAIDNYFNQASTINKPLLKYKPAIQQKDLAFTWVEHTEEIQKKINAGDSSPGTQAIIKNQIFSLFGAFKGNQVGEPGEILEISDEYITIATGDGCISINRLAGEDGIKLRPTFFNL